MFYEEKNRSWLAFKWIDSKDYIQSSYVQQFSTFVYVKNVFLPSFSTENRDESNEKTIETHIKDKSSSLKMTFDYKILS